MSTQQPSGGITQIGFGRSTQIAHSEVVFEQRVASLQAQGQNSFTFVLGSRTANSTARSGRRADVPAPPRPFVGRDTELAELERAVRTPGVTPIVVHGPAGVGSTALVSSFIERHRSRMATIWWVPCSRPELIEDHLVGLLHHLAPDTPAGTPVDALDPLLAVADPWFLVFDGCDDPATVADLLPSRGTGAVVVTATTPVWPVPTRPVTVEPLSTEAACALFTAVAGPESGLDAEGVAAVVEVIGPMPAAVRLAAAHLRDSGTDPEQLATQLRARGLADGAMTVALDAVREQSPGAAAVLELCGLSDHLAPVPLRMVDAIAAVAAETASAESVTAKATPAGDDVSPGPAVDALATLARPFDRDAAVAELVRRSLVTREAEHVRSLPAMDRVAAMCAEPSTLLVALHGVGQLLPDEANDASAWAAVDAVVPHALALVAHVESDSLRDDEGPPASTPACAAAAGVVLRRVSAHAVATDAAELGAGLARRALALAGDGRQQALAELALAVALGNMGDGDGVVDACARAEGACDDDDVVLLANVYRTYALARTLGHPAIGTSASRVRDLLATGTLDLPPHQVVRAQRAVAVGAFADNDATGAVDALEIAVRQDVPDDDLGLLAARLQLAAARRGAGHAGDARSHVADVVARMERLLPDDHPMLAWGRFEGAVDAVVTGDVERALRTFDALVAAVSGETAETRDPGGERRRQLHWARANARLQAGDTSGAEGDLRVVGAMLDRFAPHDDGAHALLLQSQASIVLANGDPGTAATILDRAALRAEGVDDGGTLVVQLRLQQAQLLAQVGRVAGAETLLAALRERLGDDGPAAPDVLFSLAGFVGMRDPVHGAKLLHRSIQLHEDRVGPHRPSAAGARAALVRMLLAMPPTAAPEPWWTTGGPPATEALHVAEAAVADLVLADVDHEPLAFPAIVALGIAQFMNGRPDACVRRFSEAERIARSPDTDQAACVAMLIELAPLWAPIDRSRAVALADEAARLADQLADGHPVRTFARTQRDTLRAHLGAGPSDTAQPFGQQFSQAIGGWLDRLRN